MVNLWDALDRKRVMPIVPANPKVYFRDPEGRLWDLSYGPCQCDPYCHGIHSKTTSSERSRGMILGASSA